MPLQSAPFFRWLQEAVLEPSGIFKTQNSVGYQRVVDAENAGLRPPNPVTNHNTRLSDESRIYLGVKYTHS